MIFNSSISWWMIKMHSRNFWSDILTGVVLLVRITSGPRLHHSAPGQTPGSLSSWLMSSPRPHPLHGHSHVFICSALLHSAVLQWNAAVYQLTALLNEGRDSDSLTLVGGDRHRAYHVTVTLPKSEFFVSYCFRLKWIKAFWGEVSHFSRRCFVTWIFYWWLTLPQNAVHRKLIKFSWPSQAS